MIPQGDGTAVELFQASAIGTAPTGAILLIHGNQGGRRLGASEFVDSGALTRLSSRLNIVTAAVSQPGFGASDGPADFCGPRTQQAVIAAVAFLREHPAIDPDRIVLYGNSRGAVAAAMVAAQLSDLRAVVLASGVYDLDSVFDNAPMGIRKAIELEAGLFSEAFKARSALHHVGNIRSEILLLHGRHDDRAPASQAEAFYEALSDAGVPVDLKVFDCGHRIPRDESQRVLGEFLERIFASGVTRHQALRSEDGCSSNSGTRKIAE
ncbi:S9 family peptidase [Ensifer sp. PDNC004]|uniref:alpha/beta hydrolase family protein n=1 Tax=Ensifer sp. PDNC004 TaxID=2811423 RepID=UPI001FEE7765|nr:alpha/beta fold hydrolase [Ensifer sp. PDNC004]